MSKEKVRDLIICLVSFIILVLAITTNVFADDYADIESELLNAKNNNTNINEIPEISVSNRGNTNINTNTNKANNVNSNSNINNNINNKVNNSSNSNSNKAAIPYAGVDYSVITIIAICGISTIYAYKKIRDYKSL